MPVDYSIYPPDWKEIRERILHRAGNCCEFCGIENGKVVFSVPVLVTTDRKLKPRKIWLSDFNDASRIVDNDRTVIKSVRVVLTICHLDHNPDDWEVSDERLRAACQMCHLRYDKRTFPTRKPTTNAKTSGLF